MNEPATVRLARLAEQAAQLAAAAKALEQRLAAPPGRRRT